MGVMLFLVKNCGKRNAVWAGVHVNHPSWHGQRRWKSLQKNSLPPNTAFHNTSWYTDTDGFLEHSPSRGSLYYKGPALHNIIMFFSGSSLIAANLREDAELWRPSLDSNLLVAGEVWRGPGKGPGQLNGPGLGRCLRQRLFVNRYTHTSTTDWIIPVCGG